MGGFRRFFRENKCVDIVSAVAGITEGGGFLLMLQASILLLASVMFLLSLLMLSLLLLSMSSLSLLVFNL
jgi:hypothetical protein